MKNAARLALLIALVGCGDDNNSNSTFDSTLGKDDQAKTLSDKDKQQYCANLESHVDLAVGLDEVVQIACAPIALLTATSREDCDNILNSCASNTPAVTVSRTQRTQKCYNDLSSCNADIGTLESCVNLNVSALRSLLRRLSCGRWGDPTVMQDVDQARTAQGCATAANTCGDAIQLF